jgi:tetratricopeptide (TPR) repeat protein
MLRIAAFVGSFLVFTYPALAVDDAAACKNGKIAACQRHLKGEMAWASDSDFMACRGGDIAACTRYVDAKTSCVDSAYKDRARAYFHRGEFDKAVSDLGQAIAKRNCGILGYYYYARAKARLQVRDPKGALSDLNAALNENLAEFYDLDDRLSDRRELRVERAKIQRDFEHYDQAIAELDTVLRGNDNPRFRLERAITYEQMGDLVRAKADFELALLQAPMFSAPDVATAAQSHLSALKEKLPQVRELSAAEAKLEQIRNQCKADPADYAECVRKGGQGSAPTATQELKQQATVPPPAEASASAGARPSSTASQQDAIKSSTLPSAAQPPVSNSTLASEKRIALVIGNGAYTNVRALKNADADVRAVAASLRNLGFKVIEKHDLDFASLIAELKSFGDKAPQYDWALVYYAGHGIEVGGTNYLIPVDAELALATHVDDEAVPLNRVLAKVEGAQKLRLVILDACRENPFIARMASAGGTRSVGRGLARVELSGAVLVAYSARDGQLALDGEGENSPFAQALLAHLGEPGLEINMLFRKVRDDVKSKTSGQQEPFTYGSLPAEALYFKPAN